MAVDSLDKRFSMLNFGDGNNLALLPDPSGSFGLDNRQQLLDCYGGISFAGSVVLLNLRIKFGSVVLLSSGLVATPSSGSDVPWEIEGAFVVRSIGASGTVVATGDHDNGQTAGLLANSGTVTVDSTVAAVIQASAEWSVADPGNSITAQNIEIQRAG